MNRYVVTWTIDIEADTPVEAARAALEIQRDPESTAMVFSISGDGGESEQRIDLQRS